MKTIEQEKILEKKLKAMVEEQMHGMCLKLLSQHVMGLPDRLCLIPPRRAFFVEVKTTGKKPRKIQAYIHDKLRLLGFDVWVLDSSEILKQIFEAYKTTNK